jgi:hypothetical protein
MDLWNAINMMMIFYVKFLDSGEKKEELNCSQFLIRRRQSFFVHFHIWSLMELMSGILLQHS